MRTGLVLMAIGAVCWANLTFGTLYFDGAPRDFQDFECSGTQSSRRLDRQAVEILRRCGPDQWTKFVRRTSAKPNELVLEITEQHPDGRRFERRLALEKQ